MTYIYALCDPRDNQIRYIGKSDNPERRLKQHLTDVRVECYRSHWIRELLALGLKPTLTIIEQIPDGQDWEERERYWIKHYRELGYPLTNGSDGGDCPPNMKGKHQPKSESAIRNIVSALISRNKSPEMREAASRSGKANAKNMHTDEAREKSRRSRIGHNYHTEQDIEALRQRNREREYDSDEMRSNARKLWDNPEAGNQAREELTERNHKRRGEKRPGMYSSEQASINARGLWDNPEKASAARARLAERNKRRANH